MTRTFRIGFMRIPMVREANFDSEHLNVQQLIFHHNAFRRPLSNFSNQQDLTLVLTQNDFTLKTSIDPADANPSKNELDAIQTEFHLPGRGQLANDYYRPNGWNVNVDRNMSFVVAKREFKAFVDLCGSLEEDFSLLMTEGNAPILMVNVPKEHDDSLTMTIQSTASLTPNELKNGIQFTLIMSTVSDEVTEDTMSQRSIPKTRSVASRSAPTSRVTSRPTSRATSVSSQSDHSGGSQSIATSRRRHDLSSLEGTPLGQRLLSPSSGAGSIRSNQSNVSNRSRTSNRSMRSQRSHHSNGSARSKSSIRSNPMNSGPSTSIPLSERNVARNQQLLDLDADSDDGVIMGIPTHGNFAEQHPPQSQSNMSPLNQRLSGMEVNENGSHQSPSQNSRSSVRSNGSVRSHESQSQHRLQQHGSSSAAVLGSTSAADIGSSNAAVQGSSPRSRPDHNGNDNQSYHVRFDLGSKEDGNGTNSVNTNFDVNRPEIQRNGNQNHNGSPLNNISPSSGASNSRNSDDRSLEVQGTMTTDRQQMLSNDNLSDYLSSYLDKMDEDKEMTATQQLSQQIAQRQQRRTEMNRNGYSNSQPKRIRVSGQTLNKRPKSQWKDSESVSQ